jgi:hypothetical protein
MTTQLRHEPHAPSPVPATNAARHPAPALQWLYEAIVEVGALESLGQGPLGERRFVAIHGGKFTGQFGAQALRGTVLPGGADRQLVRGDGVRLLDALYEMKTDDGVVLTVRNQVKIVEHPHYAPEQGRTAFSVLEVTAPLGPYAWLNDAILLGTVTPLMPQQQAVAINVYRVAAQVSSDA